MIEDPTTLIRTHLADPNSCWAIGTYGAIAEFIRDPNERELISNSQPMTLATPRGAIRLRPRESLIVAYETLSSPPHGWTHGLALCLPARQGQRNVRSTLTEIGPDNEAVMEADREGILFDIGVGAPHINAFVRTRDSSLLKMLRRECGRTIISDKSLVVDLIKEANPHRVFLSKLGRLEVFQSIGTSVAGVPEGPHTHVLQDLLALGVTHSPSIPIPKGWEPCLWLFPPHPTTDIHGHLRPFELTLLRKFQGLLESYGHADYIHEKSRAAAAIHQGTLPDRFTLPTTFLRSTALRITLRQLAYEMPESDLVTNWSTAYDKISIGEVS